MATSPDLGIEGISGMVRIMPVERLNSIMVVSPRAHYIATVQAWIEELDSIEDPASEPILQVYPVRNGNAGQLASLLSTIYGGSGASGTGRGCARHDSGYQRRGCRRQQPAPRRFERWRYF